MCVGLKEHSNICDNAFVNSYKTLWCCQYKMSGCFIASAANKKALSVSIKSNKCTLTDQSEGLKIKSTDILSKKQIKIQDSDVHCVFSWTYDRNMGKFIVQATYPSDFNIKHLMFFKGWPMVRPMLVHCDSHNFNIQP